MSSYCFRLRHGQESCLDSRTLPLCGDCSFTAAIVFDRLARNIEVAASLCRAFELGRDLQHALTVSDEEDTAVKRKQMRAAAMREFFHPGCGRSAP